MVVELSEAPTFSAREDSKWVKVNIFCFLCFILILVRFWILHMEMLRITDATTLNFLCRTFLNTWNAFLILILV